MTLPLRSHRALSILSFLHLYYLWPIWTYSSLVDAILVNITVDDESPQVSYAPPGVWSFGPNCSSCVARPNASEAYDGTWHDTTFLPSTESGENQTATLTFTGSAIYVYCIIAQTSPELNGFTDMLFFLDGQPAGSLTFDPVIIGQTGYSYNVPVYVNSSIQPGPGSHNFTLQNGRPGGQASLAMLDYIVYSAEDLAVSTQSSFVGVSSSSSSSATLSSSSSTSLSSSSKSQTSSSSGLSDSAASLNASTTSTPTAHTRTLIIAIVCSLGGALLLLALAFLVFYLRRRRNRYPYDPPPGRGARISDPATSGWVDGTWDAPAPSGSDHALTPAEPLHPSLVPDGTEIRGDVVTRDASRRRAGSAGSGSGRGSGRGRGRGLTVSSSATGQSHSQQASTSSTAWSQEPPSAALDAKSNSFAISPIRHPYASPTALSSYSMDDTVIVEDAEDVEDIAEAGHMGEGVPPLSGQVSLPAPEPRRPTVRRVRPPPLQEAVSQRQDTLSILSGQESPPPPYERSTQVPMQL